MAICLQASPYVLLGVLVSSALAAFVSPSLLARIVPHRAVLAVPVAGLSGALLPGCECASVPVAATLSRRGLSPGPAVAFLLSAPAINPLVLTATAMAFPGQPEMVAARLASSLVTALVVGWIWSWRVWPLPVRGHGHHHGGGTRRGRAAMSMSHDLTQSFGLVVVGAFAAATLTVLLPPSLLHAVAAAPWVGVLMMALLAVCLAVCSEADAFVAASFAQFSPVGLLAFMTVGPAVDLKLMALHSGVFGRGFVLRYAPIAWSVAVVAAALIGWGVL